jgi:uncharacterized protein
MIQILKNLRPKERVSKISNIDFIRLRKNGFRAIIFDIDNTLIRYYSDKLDNEAKKALTKAKELDFKMIAVSNGCSLDEKYVSSLLGMEVITKAGKPMKRSFRAALEKLSVPSAKTAVVGDRLFTDVLGANRMDIYSIYVDPLSKREPIHLKFARLLENVLAKVLFRK